MVATAAAAPGAAIRVHSREVARSLIMQPCLGCEELHSFFVGLMENRHNMVIHNMLLLIICLYYNLVMIFRK